MCRTGFASFRATSVTFSLMTPLSIRPGERGDQAAILALAERLGAFGPTTRSAQEIATRERRALADAPQRPSPGSPLLVAHPRDRRPLGVLLLETRRGHLTDQAHGHLAILAPARA